MRDKARTILGFDEILDRAEQGTGQITTFNQLNVNGVSDKPNGYYLTKDTTKTATILETKAEKDELSKQKWEGEPRKRKRQTSNASTRFPRGQMTVCISSLA